MESRRAQGLLDSQKKSYQLAVLGYKITYIGHFRCLLDAKTRSSSITFFWQLKPQNVMKRVLQILEYS